MTDDEGMFGPQVQCYCPRNPAGHLWRPDRGCPALDAADEIDAYNAKVDEYNRRVDEENVTRRVITPEIVQEAERRVYVKTGLARASTKELWKELLSRLIHPRL